MAVSRLLVALALVAVVAPAISSAEEYKVGEDNGWKPDYDYEKWANAHEFFVGDKLVFNYAAGAHTVISVNGTDFGNCTAPTPNQALSSGKDEVELKEAGKKWFICGVADHCHRGQKLVVTVKEKQSSSNTASVLPAIFQITMGMISAAVAMFMAN